MESEKFIVPISNFVIESAFKIGDVYYTPPLNSILEGGYTYTDSIVESEFEMIKNCLEILDSNSNQEWINYTLAITTFPVKEYVNFEEAFLYVNEICEKIDRSMDYFRLKECQIGNFDTLPGLAGMLNDGYKNVFKVNTKTNHYEMISGEVTIMLRKGIGMMPSREPSSYDLNSLDYKLIFSDREDEVFLNCRAALTRINEAMYMHNLNTAFIYLMTTLEMLADKDEMLQFQKVKSKIIPFIVESKKEYHRLSSEMVNLSKHKRTEIVHNGKNIFELYENQNQVKRELFNLTGIIIEYVRAVYKTDMKSFDSLDYIRKEIIETLGV
ncbi:MULTISPECIES: hypothetical protein [unclassified Exiguobacterium]|uniref:hypothetical protein n=1 Tax=unclassified Exiguobacterium TaxID=2644629 RepID=UPI001BE813FD|nr:MULTISPECIES: hypothetical protein [unclassified Exiguobacterium]